MGQTIKVTEDQVLYFRALRGHLAGPGAGSISLAARSILGAQSQQVPPSLLAISQRTKQRPTASEVKSAIYRSERRLVRSWGQRDTVHLYDAQHHWRLVVAADELWSPGGRGGPMPSDAALRKALKAIQAAGLVTRTDFMKIVPASYVKAVTEYAQKSGLDPKRFAAGRLLWRLAHQGHASIAEKIGVEQSYAARTHWFNDLDWPQKDPVDAAIELTRDYLQVYGPATPNDVAHFFGAKVTLVREWLAAIANELAQVQCGDREGLVLLKKDTKDLKRKAPSSQKEWPLRLLPLWDTMLMGHADKSWTVPNVDERKEVWRKAAMVSAVAIDQGRIVARWTHKATKKTLKVEIHPLSRWRKTKHQKPVEKEAAAVAAHLEIPDVQVSVV